MVQPWRTILEAYQACRLNDGLEDKGILRQCSPSCVVCSKGLRGDNEQVLVQDNVSPSKNQYSAPWVRRNSCGDSAGRKNAVRASAVENWSTALRQSQRDGSAVVVFAHFFLLFFSKPYLSHHTAL